MNKTALKNLATNARRELIKKVEAKALKIGITEENIKKAQFESSDAIYIDGKQLSITEKKQRDKLIQRINEIGFKRVVEEVAYTWFNRFTALRFMEVNNYLPTKVRVLSSSNPENLEPDIIKEALSVDLDIDKELVYELKVNNKTEELFKYLIIKQCNSLNKYLPFMFETIEDYKEILFPEGLLAKDSFLREMTDTEKIPESDWEKIEIIGWLYQYYIAEEKDRVFKEKKKFNAEEIPYATQLFTPDWIVRYMVQNSLGRYWVESHPEDRDLIKKWEFYLENSNPEPDFEEKLAPYINKELKVEDIKCFDPAMGSGHILVYMFDVLFEIYRKCGYMEREIPRLIIENNLYGLDIDDRAYQLACFSIVMKGMQYNSRLFRSIEKDGLNINLASIQESNTLNEQDIIYIAGESNGPHYENTKAFIEQFNNAKTFGSLIKVTEYDEVYLRNRLEEIQKNPIYDIFMEESRVKVEYILPKLLKQAGIMKKKYDVVVTNPPYMGNRYMNDNLSSFLKREYPDSKTDTFASFMEIDHYLRPNSFLAMINQHSWMFLSSYENLRKKIINKKTIYSMLHLGTRAFEEIGGEVVQTTTFVIRNFSQKDINGEYIRLVDFQDSKEKMIKTIEAVRNPTISYRYSSKMNAFNDIPSSPISYWVSNKIRDIFKHNKNLGYYSKPKHGMSTGKNEAVLRYWYEVLNDDISFDSGTIHEFDNSNKKYAPYNKGGNYRKWYGNQEFVIRYDKYGRELMDSFPGHRHDNRQHFFKEGITWTFVSSSNFGVRYSPKGFIFDVAGSSVFPKDEDINFLTAYLCSKISFEFLKVMNPTMNFQVGDVANLPIVFDMKEELKKEIKDLSTENISISKIDWDSFETSWDFKTHPLLKHRGSLSTIEDAFTRWSRYSEEQYIRVKNNEQAINKLLIETYGLKEELTEEIADEDITIRKADQAREIRSFISFAVGCIFGRYSLDQEGLVYAGGKFEPDRYKTFIADKDNILPILSGAYFEDDIVSRFIEFVKVTFGEETLEENLDFIADSLGKKIGETAKETIRRYFLNDFYKDHLQTYKRRPIYWLFTSGKQKAFNCLIYMHRYDKTTLSRIRTDYLHELQFRLDAEKKSLLSIIEGGGTAKEISNAKKELKALDLKIEELKAYDELLHHMADMQIEIDLDDGVAVNYAKFNGLLAKLK